jgi:predicted LPLAT superfamily acyltransferase
MLGVLVMLNNYFHDFATALLVVSTYVMFLMVRYAEVSGGKPLKENVVGIYPTMVHITGATLVLLLMAGIVRSFTYKWFEWVEVLGRAQVFVLVFKHIVMFAVVGYGIYLWIGMHKRIKHMREEFEKS